jgi:hypothetical protein
MTKQKEGRSISEAEPNMTFRKRRYIYKSIEPSDQSSRAIYELKSLLHQSKTRNYKGGQVYATSAS